MLGQAAVDAILCEVGWPDVPTKVGAVDLNGARERDALALGGQCLADLVLEDEGRLVLAVDVARELEGRHALGAVHEGEDRRQ